MSQKFRGLSGKYTRKYILQVNEIIAFGKREGLCLTPPNPPPQGRLEHNGAWRLADGSWAHKIILDIGKEFKAVRTCQTKGCLNREHYKIVKRIQEKKIMSEERILSLINIASKERKVLTFRDKKEATTMRMQFYNFRNRLRKTNNPEFEVADKIEVLLQDNQLVFQPRYFKMEQMLEGQGLPTFNEYINREDTTPLPEISQEEIEALRIAAGEKPVNTIPNTEEVLKNLGWSTQIAKKEND